MNPAGIRFVGPAGGALISSILRVGDAASLAAEDKHMPASSLQSGIGSLRVGRGHLSGPHTSCGTYS